MRAGGVLRTGSLGRGGGRGTTSGSDPRFVRIKCTAPLGSVVFRKRPVAVADPQQSTRAAGLSGQAALTGEGRPTTLTRAKALARIPRVISILLHRVMAAPTTCEVHPRTISGLFFIVARRGSVWP